MRGDVVPARSCTACTVELVRGATSEGMSLLFENPRVGFQCSCLGDITLRVTIRSALQFIINIRRCRLFVAKQHLTATGCYFQEIKGNQRQVNIRKVHMYAYVAEFWTGKNKVELLLSVMWPCNNSNLVEFEYNFYHQDLSLLVSLQ